MPPPIGEADLPDGVDEWTKAPDPEGPSLFQGLTARGADSIESPAIS